jgi:ABC-type uncharacterized transport system permease subunit
MVHAGAIAAVPGIAGAGLGAGAWKGGQVLGLLAAATVAGYLLIDRRGAIPLAGAFIAPLAVAVMVPAHLFPAAKHAIAPRLLNSGTLFVHVAAATLGTAALALAFGLAALYLGSEWQAKRKRPGRLFARLTSLESIDRAEYRLAVWGFVLLSLAIATGSLVSQAAAEGPLPLAPKEAFALLAWVLFAAMIQARLAAGWRGRRAALLVVIGFVLLAGSYGALLSGAPALATGVLP